MILNFKHMNCIYRISSERLDYNWERDTLEKKRTHLTVGVLIENILESFSPPIYTSVFILHSWKAIYL